MRDVLIERLGASAAAPEEWDHLLGGKGASLERLIRLGAPTPPGVCLTTDAFRHQLASLSEPITRAIASLPDETARITLVNLLADAPLAPPLGELLDRTLADLETSQGGEAARFAVRSSAVGEDSRLASFAGMHETELQLVTSGIPDAVRRCWASLWNERAVRYRHDRDLPHDVAMAVVVQIMVPADASAVVFTRHPVTQRDDQVLVNAAAGLGEALVSGMVTPDELVLDKRTLEPISASVADGQPVLSNEELRHLAGIAIDLEATFGCAIDIEAALAGGRWHVLQARPITTS